LYRLGDTSFFAERQRRSPSRLIKAS